MAAPKFTRTQARRSQATWSQEFAQARQAKQDAEREGYQRVMRIEAYLRTAQFIAALNEAEKIIKQKIIVPEAYHEFVKEIIAESNVLSVLMHVMDRTIEAELLLNREQYQEFISAIRDKVIPIMDEYLHASRVRKEMRKMLEAPVRKHMTDMLRRKDVQSVLSSPEGQAVLAHFDRLVLDLVM